MKVDIISFSRFHLYDLARYLQKEEVLNKLITSYPVYKITKWGIDKSHITTNYLEYIRIPFATKNYLRNNSIYNLDDLNVTFDKYSSKKLSKDSQVTIVLSDSALLTLREAKKQGKITILERGSSHILYADRIMKEEYRKENIKFDKFSKRLIERSIQEYEAADYIAIPSSFVKRTFLEYGVDEKKLIVNPYGVDLNKFKQIPKDDKVFRIIFAGGGSLRKGYHYLLQAFHELDLQNCELWHLGGVLDEVKPYLEKYQNDRVKLLGHIPQNELYKYYSQGSVFILPSIEEGFAMVQFQAMACGLPLVCSTNTGGEDLISKDGDEGFVIKIMDVESIKEKILYLYNNQEIAKEMGRKAKIKVESGYSWDDYGSRYIENLKTIISKKEGLS
jgi:glycosyltransferase involved in cell wall biosynthesis